MFLILSVFDGALTLWGLGLGVIEEVNPVMQRLIEKSDCIYGRQVAIANYSWLNLVEDMESIA